MACPIKHEKYATHAMQTGKSTVYFIKNILRHISILLLKQSYETEKTNIVSMNRSSGCQNEKR